MNMRYRLNRILEHWAAVLTHKKGNIKGSGRFLLRVITESFLLSSRLMYLRLIMAIITKMKNMLRRNLPPSHPGEILREMFINEHTLTITEVAARLGVSRVNLSALANKRAGISPELGIKLSEAFGNTSQFWINLQKNYELWHAEKKVNRKKIKHFVSA